MRREFSIDELLALMTVRRNITIRDIQEIFRIDLKATHKILEFLVKFDFVKIDRHYVELSTTWKPLFDEVLAK